MSCVSHRILPCATPGVVRARERPARRGQVAERHGMTPAQLALRFAMQHAAVGAVVAGATSLAQLRELLGAAERGPLGAEAMEEVELVHLRYPNPTP